MRGKLLVSFAGLAVVALFAGSALATAGEMTVSVDTTLTEDHNGQIVIDTDNVTLDCDGHKVTGTHSGHGINVDGRTGVAVLNCYVDNFESGIFVGASSNISITDNTVIGSDFGVHVDGSTSVLVSTNYVGPGQSGFHIVDSDGNQIRANYSTGSVNNYSVHSSDDNVYDGNYAEFGDTGFSFEDSHQNEITNNHVENSGAFDAFSFLGSTLNLVEGNLVPINGSAGFHARIGSINNLFVGNASHFSADVGFWDVTIGSGTAGTANGYVDNICLRNTNGGSDPAGLCNTSGTFADDDGNPFEMAIEWMAWEEITKGCNPPTNTNFCPDDNVTRGQMAAFLVRALGYSDDGGGGLFADTVGHTFGPAIDKLATAGVTKGCNPPSNTNFCPDDNVTRGQMAAFLVRALGYVDNGGGDLFDDDDGHTFEGAIDKLGTAGVTKGCNPPANTSFCPDDLVTRGQMAAFLRRALDD